MRGRFMTSAAGVAAVGAAVAVVVLSPPLVAGQTLATPAAPATRTATGPGKKFVPPRTENGQPDLQGVWSYATATPLERPNGLAEKTEFGTEEEIAAFEKQAARNFDDRGGGAQADVSRAYNDFWWDFGKTVAGKQTSLVVDPPDGRIPPVLPEATKRQQVRAAAQPKRTSEADNPEDRSLWERCITRTLPTLPGPYNNNMQIVQTKDYVVIVSEMIHDARVIPTDGRPHGTLRQWHGDSVGRWEGDTLVIDTIDFTDKSNYRGSSENLHLVERYSSLGPRTVLYQVTVSDPTTWARPFTISIPMAGNDEGMFEYACHEGNHGLEGILKGARMGEKLAAEAAAKNPTPGSGAR
jgi:hypothetical protein